MTNATYWTDLAAKLFHERTLMLIFGSALVLWYMRPFLVSMKEASSEPGANGMRGKVSRKRLIPILFAFLIAYMIVANAFNETAFIGLMLYIALDQTVISVTQVDGLLDRVTKLKSSALKREQEAAIQQPAKPEGEKPTEEEKVQGSVAANA